MSYPTALQTKKATRLLLGWPSLPLFLCDRCLADTSPRLPILFGGRDSGFYGKDHVSHPIKEYHITESPPMQ